MWNDLTMSQKAEIISMAVKAGMKDMDSIQSFYNNTTGSGRVFDRGGYKSSASIRKRITNWEGASMHTKAPDTGKVNNSFEFEERAFWNTLPKVVRDNATQEELDALFSTSYNIGSGNFRKRVVPQLVRLYSGTGTIEDVQASMYGNRDKEPKMAGLRKRRATEREMFGRAYTASHNLHSAHAAVEDAMKAVEAMPVNTSPIVDYMPRQTPTIDESINNVTRPEVEEVSILKPNSDSLFKSVANLPVPQPISIQPSSRQDTSYQMTTPEVVYSQPYLDMMAEIKNSMEFAQGGYLNGNTWGGVLPTVTIKPKKFKDGGTISSTNKYVKSSTSELGNLLGEIIVTPKGNQYKTTADGRPVISGETARELGIPVYDESRQLKNNQPIYGITNQAANERADEYTNSLSLASTINKGIGKVSNLANYLKGYWKSKHSVPTAFIDLSNENVSRITKKTRGIETILTNNFVEHNQNDIRIKKDFENTSDTLLGDKRIPLRNISIYYGIENGKLKAGPLSSFDDNTIIIPNRAKNNGKVIKVIPGTQTMKSIDRYRKAINNDLKKYIKAHNLKPTFWNKLTASKGIPFFSEVYPSAILYSNLGREKARKICQAYQNKHVPVLGRPDAAITEKGDTINLNINATPKTLFADEHGNAIFVSGLWEEENVNKVNNFLRNHPSYPIMVDNGRYSSYMTSFPNVSVYGGLNNPDDMFIIGTTK